MNKKAISYRTNLARHVGAETTSLDTLTLMGTALAVAITNMEVSPWKFGKS